MLDIFAEKFCKNLKRYFERSLQEFETLSLEESRQFHEFARTYSKHGRFTRKWRDIDKAAIKDDFLRQIVELTTREENINVDISNSLKEAYVQFAESIICARKQEVYPSYQVELSSLESRNESAICRCNNESLRVFNAVDSSLLNHFSKFYKYDLRHYLDFTNEIESRQDSVSVFTYTEHDRFHIKVNLLNEIKQSWLYHSHPPSRKFHANKFVPLFVRIYRSLRLYIVPDDGTEDEMIFTNSLRV